MNDELEKLTPEEFEKERKRRFQVASNYLMEKHKELYRRLALYDTYGPDYKSTLAYLDKEINTGNDVNLIRHLDNIMRDDDELLKKLV